MMILSVYTAKLPAEGMGRMDAIEQKILQVIDAHAEEIKAFGRDIFHHAELGYQEHRTAGKFAEALRRLGMQPQEGLAVTIPRKGAEVAKMTEKDMEDVLQIREALDELAAKIACEQISEEQLEELVATMHEFEESTKTDNVKKIAEADVKFHDIIYQSTGNPKLVNMLNNLREQMYRYRVEYLKDENNYPTLMKEHKDIVEGLVRKNKTQVTETMHQHVKNQAVAVKAMIQEQE